MGSIAVFARHPVAGRVKTRLVPALPAEAACALHRAMIEDTLAAARAAGASRLLLYWDDAAAATGVARAGFVERVQQGADLGLRLANAFDELLADPGPALVVGTDCPSLDGAALAAALAATAPGAVTLGPAADGGYWAIGLARREPALFRAIDWGGARVLDQTRERAREAGLEVRLLEERHDVDTPADLVRWLAAAAAGEAREGIGLEALRALRLLPPRDPR